MKRLAYRFTWHLTTLSHAEPQSEPPSQGDRVQIAFSTTQRCLESLHGAPKRHGPQPARAIVKTCGSVIFFLRWWLVYWEDYLKVLSSIAASP